MLVPVKSDPDYWPINSSIKAINSVGLSDGKNVHSTLDIGSGRTIKMKIEGKKYDSGKPMMGLIPPLAEVELAKVLTFGAEKYGADNWRQVPDAQRRYMDAALRHLNSVRSGNLKDTGDGGSGLSNLAHAAACIMFLLEMEMFDEVSRSRQEVESISKPTASPTTPNK